MYPPDSWDTVVDVKHRAILLPHHFGEIGSTTLACFLIFFSPLYSVAKQMLELILECSTVRNRDIDLVENI